jgi:hypothetical protein
MFLDEGSFGQVRGANPDPVPDRDPVDREQRVEVLGEAADSGRVVGAEVTDSGGGCRRPGPARAVTCMPAWTCRR